MTRLAVLLLYVVPLGLSAAFLVSRGLDVLAVGLLAVEAVVVTAVALSQRTPRTPRPPAEPRDGSTFLLAAGGCLLLVVVVLLVLVRATSG
ncbi:MAG: hypothetical protein JWM64_1770 [Frankiales bacterium]|nr:hypothetical protein [Frankiales bacterium]